MQDLNLFPFFKSVLETDPAPIVLCNLSHEIIYMNVAAIKNYSKRGGEKLIGQNLFNCHNSESQKEILEILEWYKKDEKNNIIRTFYSEKYNKDVYMYAIRDENKNLIGYYEKHEFRTKDETTISYHEIIK